MKISLQQIYSRNLQSLQKTIQSTYPANFIKIISVAQRSIDTKVSTLKFNFFQAKIQSRPEYSVITNQTLQNFFVNTSNSSVMNVRCPLSI